MSRFAFEFTGKIGKHSFGEWGYTVVWLPEALIAELPLKEMPRLRVRGEMDEYAFQGAWQPTGGAWYLMVPKAILKQGRYELGDWLNVRFNIDDQEAVDVPEELASAIAKSKQVREKWEAMTAGKKRGFCYRVSSAKTEATRVKRVAEVVELILSGGRLGRK